MKLSGLNYRSIPDNKSLKFVFQDTYLDPHTGSCLIGFSGENSSTLFTLENGKLFDPSGNFIFSCKSGDFFTLSGKYKEESIEYYVNGEQISLNFPKEDYFINNLYTETTGCYLNSNIKLYLESVSMSLSTPSNIIPNSSGLFTLTNNSDYDVYVFEIENNFSAENVQILTGNFSGVVSGNNSASFYLYDNAPEFSLAKTTTTVYTNAGKFSFYNEINKNKESYGLTDFISTSSIPESISLNFNGSTGESSFEFSPFYLETGVSFSLSYINYDTGYNSVNKKLFFSFSPSGDNQYEFTGKFLTGFEVQESGCYYIQPSYSVLDYGHVESLNFRSGESSGLFTYSCGTSIPFELSGNDGIGAGGSGNLLLKLIYLPPNLYSGTKFYIPTGYSIIDQGTGYTSNPSLILKTGEISSECFDAPAVSGEKYGGTYFREFTGNGQRTLDAGYINGQLTFEQSGITVSGIEYSVYGVKGFNFYNIGSGYNQENYIPAFSIIRSESDLFTEIASVSGFNSESTLAFNSSGDYYDFSGYWNLYTGITGLEKCTGYYGDEVGFSGHITPTANQNNIIFTLGFNQLSNDFPITGSFKLWTSGDESNKEEYAIQTNNSFPTGSGYLYNPPVNSGNFFLLFP